MPAEWAPTLGVGSVIVVIAYLSVIVGELIPKNFALRNAEGLACAVAPIMAFLSRLAAPAVWLLDGATKLLFALFGGSAEANEAVTEEEIKAIIAEGESAGILLAALISGQPLDLEAHVRQAPAVPDNIDALDVLEILRAADVPMALVHDEHGHFEELITPADILEAVAGAFKSDTGDDEPEATQREDGSWLLSGWMPVDEMAERLGIGLPEKRGYRTVAGFVLARLQHIPSVGKRISASGWQFEVVDLDGRRIDKVLTARKSAAPHRLAMGGAQKP